MAEADGEVPAQEWHRHEPHRDSGERGGGDAKRSAAAEMTGSRVSVTVAAVVYMAWSSEMPVDVGLLRCLRLGT